MMTVSSFVEHVITIVEPVKTEKLMVVISVEMTENHNLNHSVHVHTENTKKQILTVLFVTENVKLVPTSKPVPDVII